MSGLIGSNNMKVNVILLELNLIRDVCMHCQKYLHDHEFVQHAAKTFRRFYRKIRCRHPELNESVNSVVSILHSRTQTTHIPMTFQIYRHLFFRQRCKTMCDALEKHFDLLSYTLATQLVCFPAVLLCSFYEVDIWFRDSLKGQSYMSITTDNNINVTHFVSTTRTYHSSKFQLITT